MPAPCTTTDVEFTRHALERYRQRGFGCGDLSRATEHLMRICDNAQVLIDPPPWLVDPVISSRRAYLCIGDVVFPMYRIAEHRYVALTCLTRGSRSKRRRDGRASINNHINRSH